MHIRKWFMVVVVAVVAAVCAGGCDEQVRFISAESQRLETDGELTAVAFVSTFRTEGLANRQLIYQATLVDKDGKPIQSRDNQYQTAAGSVAASRTFVVHKSPQAFSDFRIIIPADELEVRPHHAPVVAVISIYAPGAEPLAEVTCDVPVFRAKAAEAGPKPERTALAAAPTPKPAPAKTPAKPKPTPTPPPPAPAPKPTPTSASAEEPAPAPAEAPSAPKPPPPVEPATPEPADTPTAPAAAPKKTPAQRESYWFMKPVGDDASPVLLGPFDSAKAALERSPDSAHRPKVLGIADEVWVVRLRRANGGNGARFVGPCLSKPEAARAADIQIAQNKANGHTVTVAGFARMRLDAWLALTAKVAAKSP